MLVRQSSSQSFLPFASRPEYLYDMGHRAAALEDSRLLPLLDGGYESSLEHGRGA
ncbi:MAG: hypothetical protein R3E72_12375 [Steroidobacteraceae bacterium]|jgi:hypothetical protein